MYYSWTAGPNSTVENSDVVIKKIEDADSAGNGMFAAKKLKPIDTICGVGQPFLLALDTARLMDTCYGCHKQPQETVETRVGWHGGHPEMMSGDNPLKLCSGCKVVRYCGRNCQKLSWRQAHKNECPLFKAVYPRIMPNYMRAVIRVIQMKESRMISQGQWDDIMKCPSHYREFEKRKDEEYLQMLQMARSTKQCTGTKIDTTTILRLYCKLKVNAITQMTPLFDPIGLCLHPLLAKINHSCNPNAYIRFENIPCVTTGTLIEVCPLRQIEPDEEITISYVDQNMPREMRQSELLDRYFFECRCSKCADSGDSLSISNSVLTSQEQKLLKKIESYIDAAESNTSKYMPIRNISYALHLLSINNWHKGLYPYPQVLQKLIVAYIDGRQFNFAMAYAAVQSFDIDPLVYEQDIHPICLVHMLVLVRLITVIYDERHSDPFDQELDLASFDIFDDLSMIRMDLAEQLRTRATKTCRRGSMIDQFWPGSYSEAFYSAGLDIELRDPLKQQRRQAKIRNLIDAMYERDNDTARWH